MTRPFEMVAVVAMARNRVIGDGAGLIWHIPADLKRVKSLTMGCPLIMGRRTWDSIGHALPGRASVVMTRDACWAGQGARRAGDIDVALALSREWITATNGARPEIILFGGGEIYAAGMPLCNRIEATIVDISPDGGPNAAVFPALNASEWNHEVLEEAEADGELLGYRYERFTRKTPVTV